MAITTQNIRLELWGGGPNPEQDLAHHVFFNGENIGYYLKPAEVGAAIAAKLIADFNAGKIK
jgi:hypothetical protein